MDPVKGKKTSTTAPQSDILVGATFLGNFEFPTTIKNIMEQNAENEGIRFITYNSENNAAKQLDQIRHLISKKVDVLILNPIDFKAGAIGVDLAIQAGIPVIGINTSVDTAKMQCYIGSNDIEAGEIAMKYIAETLNKKGNIVILTGITEQSSQLQRAQGIENVLEKYPDIHVLEKQSGYWSSEKAYQQMESWVKKYGEQINAVVAQNDEMALGVSKYLKDHHLTNQIHVVGTDGIQDALLAVKNGELDATVFQDAEGQAMLALKAAKILASRGQIARSYLLPYRLVTKENVDYYLDKRMKEQ
ncbi:substrate-binding domain-containing protein [Neobacillus muris]|uniref:substrate-binding domain-containing protein n=1 Tax=Neobacillus muris TaxID=2941334 RepID=UPI002041E4F9|nr:substrate-binding domain-containing protein [Neobacillus muris]